MDSIKKSATILSKRHPSFKRLVTAIGDLNFDIPVWRHIDDAIVYVVIGQMLSNVVSSSIIEKIKKKFSSSHKILHWASKTAGVKGALLGVSQKKRKAMKAWLEFSRGNSNSWKRWHKLSLGEYRKEIEDIWGFGRWSADMIAIFYLARKDIWPESDAGIKRACDAVFGKESNRNIKVYVKDCETVAALYLWELINRDLLTSFKENG